MSSNDLDTLLSDALLFNYISGSEVPLNFRSELVRKVSPSTKNNPVEERITSYGLLHPCNAGSSQDQGDYS